MLFRTPAKHIHLYTSFDSILNLKSELHSTLITQLPHFDNRHDRFEALPAFFVITIAHADEPVAILSYKPRSSFVAGFQVNQFASGAPRRAGQIQPRRILRFHAEVIKPVDTAAESA